MEVELCEFTKQEAEWLCDLVQEKLIDMGPLYVTAVGLALKELKDNNG